MKIASFLRCGVVIVLSLVAGRAGAQLDSNTRVSFSCSGIFGYCTMTIIHSFFNDTEVVTVDQSSTNPDIFVSYNGSFKYTGAGSVHFDSTYGAGPGGYCSGPGSITIQFTVDTLNKYFRNLVIIGNCFWYAEPEDWFLGGNLGSEQIIATLDSLSYKDSSGILFTYGVFSLSSSHTAHVDCYTHDQEWVGSCEDSGIVMDSITIEIVPNGYLNDSPSGTGPETRSLAIVDQGSESLLCTFPSSEKVRTLEIYDFLGRNSSIIPIPSNIEFIELPIASLPLGCYFARISDQVAKFVVPPR